MKVLSIVTLCFCFAGLARAEGDAASAPPSNTTAGVPVETVKVTDQDQGLFERVRDTYVRAEKKGLIAAR
jgi:hypothetical protein